MPDEVRVEVDGRTLRLSNLDKVLYPRTGTTKGEVLNYYAQVSPVLLPLLARPPGHPGPLAARRRSATASSRRTPRPVRRAGCAPPTCRPPAPAARAGTATGSSSRSSTTSRPSPGPPTSPPSSSTCTSGRSPRRQAARRRPARDRPRPGRRRGLHECCQVALLVRDKLAERKLDARPVTSGSKGMHLYADLPGRKNSDEVARLAKEIAEELQRRAPEAGHRAR